MRRFITTLSVLLALAAPAAAQECTPTEVERDKMRAASVPDGSVIRSDDAVFVKLYLGALGLNLPADANPVGVLIAVLQNRVVLNIVENIDAPCIRYRAVLHPEAHKRALHAASQGA